MDSDTSGVRIIPHQVEFKDTEANQTYKINITVKNISKTSKEIRYYPPQTKVQTTISSCITIISVSV